MNAAPKTFAVRAHPNESSHFIVVSFTCSQCKVTSGGSLPSKASYSAKDIEDVAHLVARVSQTACGCTP